MVQNFNKKIEFFLEDDNYISYTTLKGVHCKAPITDTIIKWLKQDKLQDRQIAALTRYIRQLDRTLDEKFERDSYTSMYKRGFLLDEKLKEYIMNNQ